jgi:3-deoxy-D-manno-octulosonic-acid transferase
MGAIYHLGLFIFKFLLIIVSPFNARAKKWILGRKHLFKQISASLKANEKRIWIHAASLGEFEQGRPVIEALKKQAPHFKILLTFYSPSGYEIRKNYEMADYVFYLPLDTRRNAKKFIKLVKPELVIFIKYEFWRNFLITLKELQIPTYLISTIFRKDQLFFKWYGRWYKKILDSINWFFVQNIESQQLLNKIGYTNLSVSGDTRFDRVFEISQQVKSFPVIEKFTSGHFVIIIGSSWKEDEEILFDYINNDSNNIRFIIAPHEIHDSNIIRIIKNCYRKTIRYSNANIENIHDNEILLIDNIGMLSSIYQYGNLAYIGGGFTNGIHNILEAATFGLPVIFGPNHRKFQEAIDLIHSGGAFEASDKLTAAKMFDRLVIDNNFCLVAGNICKQFVEEKKGATNMITQYILERLKEF